MDLIPKNENNAVLSSHLINLYNLALIDHKLHEDELNFLYQLGERHGLDRTEVRDIINNSKNIPFSPPITISQKVEVLYNLVKMMLIDGKLDDREAYLSSQMAKEMGLKSQVVGEVVSILVTGINENIDEQSMRHELNQLISKL